MKESRPRQRILLLIIISSLLIKLALFSYAAINVPSAKFMPDTPSYIEPGVNLVEKGVFATIDDAGNILYENNRTPGYPLFLAVLNRVFGLSFNFIILIQILLITLTGFIVYKTAYELDKNIALLASFIFLFDQPTTISSLMLLTAALYTVFMAGFIYLFLKYLRERKIGTLTLSALILAAATYIRPTSYYLGICLACGILYAFLRIDIKKGIIHALIMLLIFYSILGLWHYRNYVRVENPDFTIIDNLDLNHMGLLHKYHRDGGFRGTGQQPFYYYVNRSVRSTIEFFTLPGTLKYLKSRPIRVVSKIYGYSWMVFWIIGLAFSGFGRLEYRFLLLTILYFMLAAVIITGLCISSRLRVPAMPLISILSAVGWVKIVANLKHWKDRKI